VNNIIPFIRRKKKIKQNELAHALDISPSYLCKIEKGLIEPTGNFIKNCCKYLDVMPDVLFPSKKEKENIKNTIPLNGLWKIRKNKGIKQNLLAKMMGCSPSYLSKIEKGIQKPNDKFKKKCAKMLKVKEIDLFPQN